MKALLKKPIDGLEVGQVYELIEQQGGYLIWRNTTTNEEIEYIFNGGYRTFYGYWFVFQELPEQLKIDLKHSIVDAIGNTAICEFNGNRIWAKDVFDKVSSVLEGDTTDD